MLRKIAIASTLAMAFSVALETNAQAQPPQVRRPTRESIRSRPPISPYLNLFRNDAGVANNYFNLVRPQQEFRQGIVNNNEQINNLQRQSNMLQQEQQATTLYLQRQAAGSTLQQTGHGATFMNHGQYFGAGTRGR